MHESQRASDASLLHAFPRQFIITTRAECVGVLHDGKNHLSRRANQVLAHTCNYTVRADLFCSIVPLKQLTCAAAPPPHMCTTTLSRTYPHTPILGMVRAHILLGPGFAHLRCPCVCAARRTRTNNNGPNRTWFISHLQQWFSIAIIFKSTRRDNELCRCSYAFKVAMLTLTLRAECMCVSFSQHKAMRTRGFALLRGCLQIWACGLRTIVSNLSLTISFLWFESNKKMKLLYVWYYYYF